MSFGLVDFIETTRIRIIIIIARAIMYTGQESAMKEDAETAHVL